MIKYLHPNRGQHRVIGVATGTDYAYHAGGDTFLVNKEDIKAQPHLFQAMGTPRPKPTSIMMDGTEKPIPKGAKLLSNNSVSMVWRANDGWIYKRSIPYLIENELSALTRMSKTGFVPAVERYDKYTLKIQDVGQSEPITDTDLFISNCTYFLLVMQERDIRHGDLTTPHVIVKDNSPIVIDWAESRVSTDPAPDKRKEGDRHWMGETMIGTTG